MATVEKGTALTCGHESCGCRVLIDEVCTCPGGSDHYTCICGSPMAAVDPPGIEGGELLTCGHEGCTCQVRIGVACHCPDAGESYTCICGSPLVAKAA